MDDATAPRVCEMIAKFGEFIAGMDALATTAIWEKLFLLTCPRPGAIDGFSSSIPRW